MRCPKCGYDQIPANACAGCGIIFSKYYEIQKRKADDLYAKEPIPLEQIKTSPQHTESSKSPGFIAHVVRQASLPWSHVSIAAVIPLSIGFAIVFFLQATVDARTSESLILFMIHNVNLVFHEAGHWIFGVWGNETLMILGGSLNQVLIPLVVSLAFWARRDAAGLAFGLFWLFENFLDVAVYMADARALELPLIGGLGEEAHDWRNLFLHWNLLAKDTLIARYTRNIGWLGMCLAWAWLIWRWFAGIRSKSPQPPSGKGSSFFSQES